MPKTNMPSKLPKKKLAKLQNKYGEQLSAALSENSSVEIENVALQQKAAQLEAAQTLVAATPLVESEEIYRLNELQTAILNNAGYAVISTTVDGTITTFNPMAERMLGYKAQELIGKLTPAAFHDLDEVVARAKIFSDELKTTIEPGFEVFVAKARLNLPNEYEWTYIRKDGSRFPVLLSVTALRNARQEIIGFLGIANDITERKKAEKSLVQASALDAAGSAIVITSPNGIVEFINPAFTKITGYGPEDILGKKNNLLKSGKHDEAFYAQMWQSILKGETWRGEVINRRKDGSLYYEDQTITPVLDDQGKISHFVSIKNDITARKESEARLLDAIENMDSGFVMFGPDERLILCNTRYKELYPKSAHLMVPGTPYEDILRESYRQGNYAYTGLSEEEWLTQRLNLHRAAGSKNAYEQKVGNRWIRINDARASNGGVVSLRTDITANKQIEAETAKRAAELQAVAEISTQLAAATTVQQLLQQAADLTKDRFQLYHVHIYLLDEANKKLTLAAGAGVAGAEMVKEGHTIVLSHPRSLVARAARTKAGAVSNDITQDPDFLPNPHLPNTRAEMAIPIIVGENILGVFDIQADTTNRFTEADIAIKTTLARQIGSTLQNVRAVETISKTQEQYQLAAEGANDGLWDWDVITNQVYFSPRWKEMVGYNENELTNGFADFEALLHPEDRDQVLTHVNDYLAGTIPAYDIEFRFHHKDGSYRWIRARGKALRTPDGKPYRMAGSHTDITANKQAETLNAKRAAELQAVAEISTEAAAATTVQQMLQRVVDLTKDRFALYHTHIYLLDETSRQLVLTAGADKAGAQMVKEGRTIDINHPHSLVARAARNKVGVISNNVSQEPDFLPNPLLPNTHAELATPISVGNTLLGVFDVQADYINRFNDEDIAIQTTLARQIGTALQNVRAIERAEKAAAELNLLTRRLVREGWQDYSSRQLERSQFIYELPIATTAASPRSTRTGLLGETKKQTVITPLAVRGEVIGELALAEPGELTEAEEITQAIAVRLSAHIDNLRLTEQTQVALAETSKRATEIEAVSEVSAATSTILERDQLIARAVQLTQRRFRLYHCHVFLFDHVTNNLAIAACGWREGDIHEGTHGKRIINLTQEQSLVAEAARNRAPVLVNNVHDDPHWLPNELLPETKSEIAIPMIVGEVLIGIFDVQSEIAGRFNNEDVRTFSTLANALAIAVQNANLYEEQAAAVARLRELDQLKSSFLANMSHELRTPLNSIIGFTEVLLEGIDGELTEAMENDLRVVHKNGQHLLNLINDVLDMAKIEAGRMTLTLESVSFQEVIEEVLDITRPLAEAKNLAVRSTVDINADLNIEADRIRMRQVMINIINNSIKFTEMGGITIRADRGEDLIRVSIQDTGIGIPPDHVDKIFQEFTQVDTSTTRKAGGTGLGLPISRHLVELHGGRLWAESKGIAGEGSTFYIELPIIAKKQEIA